MSKNNHDNNGSLTYVVGEEKRLIDILTRADVMPLLEAGVRTGLAYISITNDQGDVLWQAGNNETGDLVGQSLSLEGEVIGYINFERESMKVDAANIIHAAIQSILTSNLKRMLTTEVHASVVNLSYDELVEANQRLSKSEKDLRNLAGKLEAKVRERTAVLEQAYARLMQQEKMVSIGQLAAGMAHEINNPIGFITSNLGTLRSYFTRYKDYFSLISEAECVLPADTREILLKSRKDLKLELITEDIPALIEECLSGAGRIKVIVSDLRGFSHIDDVETLPVDLNNELDKLLSILSHEISGRVSVIKEFEALRPIIGKPALLSQAFLNIMINSLASREDGLEIKLSTTQMADRVCVCIQDNGPGIPDENINRVFDPFFTTRDVGKGMGLGLTIVYDIVKSHNGTIEIVGHPGTTVKVYLPEEP